MGAPVVIRSPLLMRPLLSSVRRQFHAVRPLSSGVPPESTLPPASLPANSTPLIYPQPASSEHRDLPSFLDYAERTSLNTTSTVYVGTHYEYTVAQGLASFGFHLQRVGRAGDCGIDLLGTWDVPAAPDPLRVLLQCKATLRASPGWVRELEGAFAGAPPGWRGSSVMAFLVTDKPATPGIRKALASSLWPMGYLFCTRAGGVHQVLWNHRSEELWLRGLGVSKRHSLPSDTSMCHEVLLTWQGKQLPLLE